MADCSRPPQSQPRSVFGFRSKGAYDDVFVSKPKIRAPGFTPGVKDYAEIFNCSSSKPSSIPVLDLEEFHKEVDDEVIVDYGNVFGALNDAKIGFSYEDVFSVAANGVSRRANDSHSHSETTAQCTAVEDTQKPLHESLCEKKRSMSSVKITCSGKGDADEINGVGKFSEVSVPASLFDGTVPLKKDSVSRSDRTANNFKQYGDELPVVKHSRNVSSSGVPTHCGDGFIEIDSMCRSGSDRYVSSDTQMEINIIRPNVQISEATTMTDSSLYLGASMFTYSDVQPNNARGEVHGRSNESLVEGVHVQSMHGPDKPLIRDPNEVESVVKHNAVRSTNLFHDPTREHDFAPGVPELATGNSIALNSDISKNAKGDTYHNSLRDAKSQVVNGSRGPSVIYYHVNASDAMPHEQSDLAPVTESQQSFGKMNTAFEGNLIPEITDSRNVDSESTYRDSSEHQSDSVKSKNEVEDVNAAKKKASKLKIDASKRSTYLSANNSPCSSDDEIEKHSEASISAAAVKKAIKEAQALINVAKESNGVKGFMSLAMARKSGQVKVAKEEHNSKVYENPKFFEVAHAKIQNNLSRSAANTAPWPSGSEMKSASADKVIGGSNVKETVFNTVDKPYQKKAVEMQSSLKEKTQESATTQHAPPSINSFQEKLAVYSSIMDQKLAPRKDDVALCGIVAGSRQIRIVPEAYCSVVPNVEKVETEVNSARQEAFLNNIPESYTWAEIESWKAMNSSNQGSVMQSFHDNFVKTTTGCSVDSFEVKQDAVATTEHIDTDRNAAIKVESEGHASSDLTSLEKENMDESELDPHVQVLDCEDTDSQDYASAEENWVPTDTDDEINEKDHHFSAENNLNEIDKVENMLAPEVTVSSEDILPPILNNLPEDLIVEETDVALLRNILKKGTQVSDESRAPIVHNSDDPVVEETEKSEDMSLPNMVIRGAEVTSEEVDLIGDEAIGREFENGALHIKLIHEVKFTSEETTVPVFNYSEDDPIVEEADISEDASVLLIVSPTAKITSEDNASACFNSANGDTSVETEGTVDMTERTMVTHVATIISENDIAPCYDKSNEDQIVEDNGDDTKRESIVSLNSNEHEEGTTRAAMLHEQTNLSNEKLDCIGTVETESVFCAGLESSHHEGSEFELISTDDLAEESAGDAMDESLSTPWTFDRQNQEIDGTNFFDPDPKLQQDREDLRNDAGAEANAAEEGHLTMNIGSFKNDNAIVDAAGKEDATETESTSWSSEHLNSELEAEIQNIEPFPDSIKYKETTEVEQLSEDSFQQFERLGRRKWDVSRETFKLPELKTGSPDIQDTMTQDSNEIERLMDKHERKKWEIPRENFELPVLGDEVVDENKENEGHDTERATQSAEKPERRKWKIQKEVFEVPILCAEAVQDPLDHEGFVIAAEEMRMTHNLSNTVNFPEKLVQLEVVYDEFSATAKPVPGEAASCQLSSESSDEEITKKSVPEFKMVSEEEPCKQLGETYDKQDSKLSEGKAIEQENCMKGTEDFNVKDEIKRTLENLWKKIYNIKQDEASESVELTGKENVNDTIGHAFTKDLNLNGPVQLVESPRQFDDTETPNFSGYRKGNEDGLESSLGTEPFSANESSKSREFVSMETEEVQGNSSLESDSCKYQENEKGSEENENCYANYPESQPEEALSGLETENGTERTPTHEECNLKKEGTSTCNIPPSKVNEHRQMDSETVSGSERLMVDESLVDNAGSPQKTKVLTHDELNDVQDDISDENLSEAEAEMHLAEDLSDKRCTNSEHHDTNTSRKNMESVADSKVLDTMSHGLDQMTDKNATCPDKIEQTGSWKWIFGDELRDKSNIQDEVPDIKKLRDMKGKTKETVDDNDISHISGKVKIDGDKPTLMDDTVPNRMHQEMTSDQDVLKNLLRAKELERIAVERAIREARERAFIEARERAAMERANTVAREISAKEKTNLESRERIASERANLQVRERVATERVNADAHQKVNSNVQERSQRTSSEAKLGLERNSLEAKRKAELERAAVERATTEARQRALEKAMSKKELVTENSSRSASTSGVQYGSASKEKLNEDKPSESALRFKARNERHQRIAERAANALAEKNMRDLLVQREQAERNKLAEVLDADVKRWARGKTGNLRALLSTLQYILGPDSGWQAIHLTEIVTADAVKKAYRKATLFVHPDKLQQRGATIRQKYICEKVFDLLKEAWNKFDRDER